MYSVGDIVYSTLPDSGKIVPLQIVEIVTIKKINSGSTTKYKVLLPSKNQKIYDLSKFEKVFTNIEEIKSYLLNNATKFINNMILEANDLENKYFVKKQEEEEILNKENIECKNDDQYVKIDLGNGQVGRIKPDFDIKDINEESTAS